MTEKIKRILASLDAQEQDELYRVLWAEHVKEDIEAQTEQDPSFEDMSEEEYKKVIDKATRLYVYGNKYDCNQSYWDNIDAVIKLALNT